MECAQCGSSILAPDPPRPHSIFFLSKHSPHPPLPSINQAPFNPITLILPLAEAMIHFDSQLSHLLTL